MSVQTKTVNDKLRKILDLETFKIPIIKKGFYGLKHHRLSADEINQYRKYIDGNGVFFRRFENGPDFEGKMASVPAKILAASTFYNYNPDHHIIIMRDGNDTNLHPSNILVLTKEKALEIVIEWLQRKEPEREFKILDTEIYSPFYIASDEGQIFSLVIMDYLKPNKQESGYIKIELRLSETNERLPKSMQLHRLI